VTTDCPHAGGVRRARFDSTAGLLRTGYPYLLELRAAAGAGTLQTRLLGRRTTIVSGAAGARLFYDESIMRRRGSVPLPLRRVLFGLGAVHGLDDTDHKHRKALFLDLLTPAAAKAVAELADGHWREQSGKPVDPAAIFHEAVPVHGAAICEWAGVPTGETYPQLHRDLMLMVDGFGSAGRRYARAYRARQRSERWARDLVVAVRDARFEVPGTALEAIATYRGRDRQVLPPRVAGVELLNILRPSVAVAYFVAFTADALAAQPELRERLRGGGEELLESLADEVRRFYPFVPMVAAKVRRSVTVDGIRLRRGGRVLLDVYGTLHDPQLWAAPEQFEVDRFVGVDPDLYTYFPQGGGDPVFTHRCPGERVAIELIKAAARHLVDDRPPVRARHDYPLNRIPTRPLPG
jgi:fatty-acid peroxygenase